jgi:hypothetical protein
MKGRNFRSELDSILNTNATAAHETQSPNIDKTLLLEQSFNVVYKAYFNKPVGNNITFSSALFTHERIIYFNGEIVHTQILDDSLSFVDALFVRLMSESGQTVEDITKRILDIIIDAHSQLYL